MNKRLFLLLTALILIGAFALALLHLHADGGRHDCPVCRLVQTFGRLFAFAVIAFLINQSKARQFVPVPVSSRKSRLLTSKLRDRSPPFLK